MGKILLSFGIILVIAPFMWNIKTSVKRPAKIATISKVEVEQTLAKPTVEVTAKKNSAPVAVRKRENLKIDSPIAAARGREHSQALSPTRIAKSKPMNSDTSGEVNGIRHAELREIETHVPTIAGRKFCEEHEESITEAANIHEVSPIEIKTITRIESNCRNVRGKDGEIGLMQVMPITAKDVGADPEKLWNPRHNIHAGTAYFSKLRTQFGKLEHALLAYNRGPNVAQKMLEQKYDPERDPYVRNFKRFYKTFVSLQKRPVY